MFRLRSQVESVVAERDALKENLSKFTEEKEMLIVESEDTAQKLEKLHEAKMRWGFGRVNPLGVVRPIDSAALCTDI